jgi:hypothetical protein
MKSDEELLQEHNTLMAVKEQREAKAKARKARMRQLELQTAIEASKTGE